MQAMQPRVKELQAKYANDPERLQVGGQSFWGVGAWRGCRMGNSGDITCYFGQKFWEGMRSCRGVEGIRKLRLAQTCFFRSRFTIEE